METSGITPKVGIDASAVPDVARLFEASGPFVTVYLTTEPDIDNAAQRSLLRWKGLRRELIDGGAPEAALEAIDGVVEDAHTKGGTLVAVANADGLLLTRHEPDPPVRDVARVGPLPSVGPLLESLQSRPPHVVVLADRTGADIFAFVADGGESASVAGAEPGDPHLRKTGPGGWSQRRYQNRAENQWQANAKEVADRLASVVDETGARLVVAAGDVRALQLLREELPGRVADLVREVEGSRGVESGIDDVSDDVAKLVATTVADDTAALIEKFREELGQGDRAVEGVGPTLTALAAAQVDSLLVADEVDDERTAWFGPAPGAVAVDAGTVSSMGVEPEQARLVDVAIRAALTTGAAVRIIPSPRAVRDGIGAVLRFTM
jgi:hypothetical protein